MVIDALQLADDLVDNLDPSKDWCVRSSIKDALHLDR